MMNPIILPADHINAIDRAADLIQDGGVIAFPTDTVYGIGVTAFQEGAIDKLYRLKGRSALKAIPILLGETEQISRISPPLSPLVTRFASAFWPGPLTIIVSLLPSMPANLSPTPTIGLRIPDHEFIRDLLRVTGPLAATSANLSGEPSALSASEVKAQFGSRVDLILDGGRSPREAASTVLDCTTDQPAILREGPISWAEILSVLNDPNE